MGSFKPDSDGLKIEQNSGLFNSLQDATGFGVVTSAVML